METKLCKVEPKEKVSLFTTLSGPTPNRRSVNVWEVHTVCPSSTPHYACAQADKLESLVQQTGIKAQVYAVVYGNFTPAPDIISELVSTGEKLRATEQ